MNNGRIRAEIASSLRRFWSEVTPLDEARAGAILEDFAHHFVRSDLLRRFRKSFGGWGVKDRFLIGGIVCEADDTLSGLLMASAAAPTAACVVWGSFRSPFGFSVVGVNRSPDKLFIIEDDAVASMTCGARAGFLFCGENLGRTLFFPAVSK